jgi:ABC-type multidrug transport system fused ATPase/permease subunit
VLQFFTIYIAIIMVRRSLTCVRNVRSNSRAGWSSGGSIRQRQPQYVLSFVLIASYDSRAETRDADIAQATEASNRIISTRISDHNRDQGSDTLEDAEGGAKIEFKSLYFTYPTRDVPVFKNLSFTVSFIWNQDSLGITNASKIEKGQFAALVGPSGMRSSSGFEVTLLMPAIPLQVAVKPPLPHLSRGMNYGLMLNDIVPVLMASRFYDYHRGSILINGTELRSLDVEKYRKSLSLVSQEPTLYQGLFRYACCPSIGRSG